MKVEGPLNVVLATEAPEHYSTVIRGLMPLDRLKDKGLIEVSVHRYEVGSDMLSANLDAAHVVYAVNNGNEAWNGLYRLAVDNGRAFVHDMDDNLWDVHPMNQAFRTLGCYEAEATNSITRERVRLWTQGQDGFDLNRNRRAVMAVEETARIATAISTTTERMARLLSAHNPRVFVLPNCADLRVWNPYKAVREGFRIGWQGSQSHKPDMIAAGRQIGDFVRKHEDVTFFVAGEAPIELTGHIPPERLEVQPWVNAAAYPFMMQCAALDIGLAPILDTRFNRCKSSLKWVEYGAMQVPTLASAYAPYSDDIRDGHDGWLTEDGGWFDALERLYADRKEVRRVGWNARERVEADFDIDKRCMDWMEMFRTLVGEERTRGRSGPAHCLTLGGRLSK